MPTIGTTYALPADANSWLSHELDPEFTRQVVTIVSGAGNLVTGTVLGKITASGKYNKHVNGAADGTETAVAVLLNPVDATSADQKALVEIRDCVIKPLGLVWDTSVNNQTKKDAALAQLATKGFSTRTVV